MARIRTKDAREMREMILAARRDIALMLRSDAREIRLTVRGHAKGQAYLRTLNKASGTLYDLFIYGTCVMRGRKDYEFEYARVEFYRG